MNVNQELRRIIIHYPLDIHSQLIYHSSFHLLIFIVIPLIFIILLKIQEDLLNFVFLCFSVLVLKLENSFEIFHYLTFIHLSLNWYQWSKKIAHYTICLIRIKKEGHQMHDSINLIEQLYLCDSWQINDQTFHKEYSSHFISLIYYHLLIYFDN